MNPYLPDLEEYKKYYDMRPTGDVSDMDRQISFTHPYKTVEDVEKALDKASSFMEKEGVYAKMAPSLRSNHESMLRLVQKDARAYAYTIGKDMDFNVRALKSNPLTYNMIPAAERDTKEVSDAYLESMRGQISRAKISPSEYAMMYKHQFSQNANLSQVSLMENYKQAYQDMVRDGAYINGAYSENAMYIATARTMAKDDLELLLQYDNIEKDIWYDSIGRNRLREASYSDRSDREQDELLLAAEERCPEMKPSIERQQKQYQQDKEQMLKLSMADQLGWEMQPQDREMLDSLREKGVEMNAKEKERMKKLTEKTREESAYFLQNDSIENIIAAYVSGEISLGDALSGAGKIGGLQTHGNHGRVVEMTAQAEDLEQHHSQDISDPEYSPGSENYERAEEEREEIVHEQQEIVEEERDVYEEEYAGNPFVSYEDPNGMEPTFNPFDNK